MEPPPKEEKKEKKVWVQRSGAEKRRIKRLECLQKGLPMPRRHKKKNKARKLAKLQSKIVPQPLPAPKAIVPPLPTNASVAPKYPGEMNLTSRQQKKVLFHMLKDLHPSVRRTFSLYSPMIQILAKIAISGPSPQTDDALGLFNLNHLKNSNFQDLLDRFRPMISKLVQSATDSGPYNDPEDEYFGDEAGFGPPGFEPGWDSGFPDFPGNDRGFPNDDLGFPDDDIGFPNDNRGFPDDGLSIKKTLAKLASYIGILKKQGAFSGSSPGANALGPVPSQSAPMSGGIVTPAQNSRICDQRRPNIGSSQFDTDRFDNDRFDNGRINNDRFDNSRFGDDPFDDSRFDNSRFDNRPSNGQFDTERFDSPQFAVRQSEGHQFVTGRSDARQFGAGKMDSPQFDAGRPGSPQFGAGPSGVRQFNAARSDGRQFDAGRSDSFHFDAGRPDGPQFDAGRPDSPQFGAGPSGVRQFNASRSEGRHFSAGQPDGPQFDGGRPDGPQYGAGRSNGPQFGAGPSGVCQFNASRSEGRHFGTGQPDGPQFGAGRSGGPQFDTGRPNARQFDDRRPIPASRVDDLSMAERSKDWRLSRYHELDVPNEPATSGNQSVDLTDDLVGRCVRQPVRGLDRRDDHDRPFVYPRIGVTEATCARRLTRTEAEMVELALFKRITSKDEVKCHGVYRECGAVIFVCDNDQSARWLVKTVPFLLPWAGAVLKAEPFCKRLNSTELLFELPTILSNMPWPTFCEKIQLQNDRLHTADWKLIVEEETTRVCSIDTRSLRNLRALNFKAFLSFFQIEFKLISLA